MFRSASPISMKLFALLPILLAGSALASPFAIEDSPAIANSKIAQYATLDDCRNNRNLLTSRRPLEGQCYIKDWRAQALYLVRGTCCAGAHIVAHMDDKCQVKNGGMAMGECITPPWGTQSHLLWSWVNP
ncbi:hypothetical protein K491DRAFT_257790 [Lophiostoma macrostomum CBS 122681]|uniref:Secreted protein n=1 Tax=Lophiostoma macrostomum CBS 122681 TaxID=1314788 RepID=A0A6A6SND5_9PLEO|nr:hypothetical protein K491DRAFT_257790 [Lophiostoma macrostomum CBS 122681]